MHYRITGWHHGINLAREVRAFIETADGVVVAATKNFQWSLGKPIAAVLAWVTSKRLRWAVAETRDALDLKRGRKLFP